MENTIRMAIRDVLLDRPALLRIPLRQRAKFEGWLKFELAYHLEQIGMQMVEVEAQRAYTRERADILFFDNEEPYWIELKTPNTNWRINGVNSNSRPVTKNIRSIVDDAKKLNSSSGIVAFVLFPIPPSDDRWKDYIYRIAEDTGLKVTPEDNCIRINVKIDDKNTADVVICSFASKRYHNWSLS